MLPPSLMGLFPGNRAGMMESSGLGALNRAGLGLGGYLEDIVLHMLLEFPMMSIVTQLICLLVFWFITWRQPYGASSIFDGFISRQSGWPGRT